MRELLALAGLWFCCFVSLHTPCRAFVQQVCGPALPRRPPASAGPPCSSSGRSGLRMSSVASSSGDEATRSEGQDDAMGINVGPLKYETTPLATGLAMETLSQFPSSRSQRRSKPLPPLLFLHGSYHAAWCWAEHWMPFMASRGYDTYAISLRGTSGTPVPGEEPEDRPISLKVEQHMSDVKAFVQLKLKGRAPVVIGHSFGGLLLMKLFEESADAQARASMADDVLTKMGMSQMGVTQGAEQEDLPGSAPPPPLAGGAFLCSVPSSGNGKMTSRFIKEKPLAAVLIVLGFVAKLAVKWPWLARALFFSKDIDPVALNRYMDNFRADSKVGYDLVDLAQKLPSKRAREDGSAEWLAYCPPSMVMGGELDYIVDQEGVRETAAFLGVSEDMQMLSGVPHDLMLGPTWRIGAERLLAWLEDTDFGLSAAL